MEVCCNDGNVMLVVPSEIKSQMHECNYTSNYTR